MINVSFAEVKACINDHTSRPMDHDVILGLARGGLVPAVMLSHKLNIPLVVCQYSSKNGKGTTQQQNCLPDIQGMRILIVDDINDTGHTLKEVFEHYKHDNVVEVYTLVKRMGTCFDQGTASLIAATDDWYVFPWEIEV